MFRITYSYPTSERLFYVLTDNVFEWIGTLMDLNATIQEVI